MMIVPGVNKRSSQNIITCPHSGLSFAPADATTYWGGAAIWTTAAGHNRIYFRKPCLIKEVRCSVTVAGTLGTTEQATLSVRKNDTTDTTVSSTVQFDNAGPVRFDNTTLNVAIAAGDFIELKIVMPTFVTNPTTVFIVTHVITEE